MRSSIESLRVSNVRAVEIAEKINCRAKWNNPQILSPNKSLLFWSSLSLLRNRVLVPFLKDD